MEASKLYIYRVADDWMFNKYDEKYTRSVQLEFTDRIKKNIKNKKIFEYLDDFGVFDCFTRDYAMESHKDFFTKRNYELNRSLEYLSCSDAKKNLKKKYFKNINNTSVMLFIFLETLGKLSDKVFPQDLTEANVRDTLLNTMGGIDGVITFNKGIYENNNFCIEINYFMNQFDNLEYNSKILLNESIKTQIPYMVNLIFN